MPGIGDLVANLTVDAAPFAAGLKSAQKSMGSFVTGIGGLATGIAGVLGTAFAAGASVSSYKTQMESERKLAAVLETTGHAAGLTIGEMKGLASELQNVTNYGDEATLNSMALLATFKEIKGDVFGDATAAIQDMAAVMGTDLKGATIQVGKALNNPIAGMSALADAGVSFTEQQKQQIRTMQEAGNIAGAQGLILTELSGEFGGAAKALADPWTQAKNAIGDVGEMLGSLLLPVIDVASITLQGVASYALEFGDTFKAAGIEAAIVLSSMIEWVRSVGVAIYDAMLPAITSVMEYLGSLFTFVAGDGVSALSSWYIEAAVFFGNFGGIVTLAATQFELFTAQLINDAAYTFTDVIPAYVTWFADNWSDVLFTAVDYAATIFINLGQNIRNMWSAVLSFIQGNGFEFDWTPLTEGARSAIDSLPEIPERVSTEFEKSLQNDIAGMTSDLGSAMEQQRAQMIAEQDKQREVFTAKYDTASKLPIPDQPTQDQSDGKKDKTSLTAAFAGSREALQIAMRGIGGKNPAVDIAREQLKVSREQLELQRQQASGGGVEEMVVAI